LQLVQKLPFDAYSEILQIDGNKMRTLSDVADEYERWAAEDDAMISGITRNVGGLADGVREEQLRFATLLAEEARNLRDDAKRLRRSGGLQA
jgi:hypothetical protein